MIEHKCPECGELIESPDLLGGETDQCPSCRSTVRVPYESLDDEDSLMDEDDDSGSDFVSTYSPMKSDPSPERWSRLGKSLPPIAFGIALLCHFFGGFALHVWTAYLYYNNWGTFWAIAAFIFPVFSEVVAFVLCFGWGVWFYSLAVAAWIGAVLVYTVVDAVDWDGVDWRISAASGVLMILLVGSLAGSFGYFAVGYAASPRPMTTDFQKELDDVSTAVCSVLNVSSVTAFSAEDVKATAEVIEAKASLRKRLRRYDGAALARVRKSVNVYLLFMRLLQQDLTDCFRRRDQEGQAQFALREPTREVIEHLPSGVKPALGPMQVKEIEKVLSQLLELPEEGGRLPPGWEDRLKAIFDRQWRAYGEVYRDLLGCPMPTPDQLKGDDNLTGS